MAGVAIGGAALIGGVMSYAGSSQAANAENNASNNSIGAQQTEYNQQVALNQPWVQSGQQNLNQLNSLMPSLNKPFDMSMYQQSPGYAWQQQQGQQAIQRSAAASGLLNSAGTQQNLLSYSQGLANSDYQQALQNYMSQNQQTYNMYAGMAGNGQTAIGMIGNAGANATNNISNTMIGQGQAQAAGAMGQANAIGGALNTGANGLMMNSLLNKLSPQNQNPGGMPNVMSGTSGLFENQVPTPNQSANMYSPIDPNAALAVG